MTNTDPEMRPGDIICEEYTLKRRLGAGAFGEVWLATQDRLRRDVALKFAMSSLLEGVEGGAARFAQEAITHGQLDHRHIVPLHDARSHDGVPFLVMPYVRGGTLADKAGKLTVDEVVRHGVGVCDALAYAHKRKVVHRDIKPVNLLLDDDGEVRVADFGIAKLLDSVLGSSGTVAGTEGFAAPEQLRGTRVDPRADIYGLGATLLYLATARSTFDLVTKRRDSLLASVDPALRPVIDKMTELEPEERYRNAGEARAALLAVLGGSPLAAVSRRGWGETAWAFVVGAWRSPPVLNFVERCVEAARVFSVVGLWTLVVSPVWLAVLTVVLLVVAGVAMLVNGPSVEKPVVTSVAVAHSAPSTSKKEPAAKPVVSPAPNVEPVAAPRAGQTWVGASGYTMVWVPAGTFDMGSPVSESGRFENEHQHRVTLTHGYWAGKTEVTQGMWSSVTGANPSHFSACGTDCPVEQVSWCDSVSFANAVSRGDGLRAVYTGVEACAASPGGVRWDRSATGYRLATEAEWEMAARGSGRPDVNAGGELDAMAWHGSNSGYTPHRVCTKQANALGLCDPTGNVWEWTWDWYGDYPGEVTDPVGPVSGSYRVIRGGSWYDFPNTTRVSSRDYAKADYRNFHMGLRLVRSSLVP